VTPPRTHADEVVTDPLLVRRLLAAQFPRWADLAISAVASAGTDNAIYRLGDDLAVRLPRIRGAARDVDAEHRWLPRLAPHLPLAIPVPLARGIPAEGYPYPWSVHRWLDGEDAAAAPVTDLGEAVTALGRFVRALQRLDPVRDGRLSGVIDFGGAAVGDPAADTMAAWTFLSAGTRPVFRSVTGVDDATWIRGWGLAASWGVIALPYYRHSNPVLAGIARRAIDEALADG